MAKVNDILNKYGVKRDRGRAQVDTVLGKYGVKPSSVSTPKQPESKSAVNPLMETMTSGRGSTGSVYNDVRVALFGPSALLPSRPRTTEERIKDAETSVTNWEKQVEEIKERTRTPVVGSTSYGRGSDPALSKPAPTVGSTSYGAGSATQVTKNEELERAEEALRQSRKALDGLQQTKYWADARMTGIEGLQDKLEHLADDEGTLKQVRRELDALTDKFEGSGGAETHNVEEIREYNLTRTALQSREAELAAQLDARDGESERLRQTIAQLQREREIEQLYARYLPLMQTPDFQEKSVYQTTANGLIPVYNRTEETYDETGFDDILYDAINGNEDARSMLRDAGYVPYEDIAPEQVQLFNYIYITEGPKEAYAYMDLVAEKQYNAMDAAGMAFLQGSGIAYPTAVLESTVSKGLAALTGDKDSVVEADDVYSNFATAAQESARQHPVASTVGNVGGNLTLLWGANALFGAVEGALALQMAPAVQSVVNSSLSFLTADAVRNAGALATGNMEPADYLKSAGVSGAQGLAGGLASGLVSSGMANVLLENGMMTPFMEFVRQSTSGFVGAGVNIGTGYLFAEEQPSKEQIATDFATAFLFSVIQGGISTYKTTQATKTQMNAALNEITQRYAQMSQEWQTMTPEGRAEAANYVITQTENLRSSLNSYYLAGQQTTVDQLNRALDGIIQGMQGYIYGFQAYQSVTTAPGNMLGSGAATGGDTALSPTFSGSDGGRGSAKLQGQLETMFSQGLSQALTEISPGHAWTGAEAQQGGAAKPPVGMDEATYSRLAQAAKEMYGADQTQKTAPGEGAGKVTYDSWEVSAIRKEAKTFRNLVAGFDSSVAEFFAKWRDGRKSQNGDKLEKLYLGKMSRGIAEKVSAILGYDVDVRDFIITNDDVKHIMDEHGDPEAEIKRGNLPLDTWVFDRLQEVVTSPDSIEKGKIGQGKKNNGKQGVIFSKTFPDGKVVCIQFDNSGRGTMEVATIYVRKGSTTSEIDADTAPIRTPETPEPVLPSDPIIPSPGDGVNIEYAPGGGMDIPMDEGTVSRLTKAAKEMYGADQAQKTAHKKGAEGGNIRLTEEDLSDYMQVGERQHVRDQKIRIADSGSSPVLTSPEGIRKFVQQAIKGEVQNETRAYGRGGAALAEDVSAATDGAVRIEGYYLELEANALKHLDDHIVIDKDGRNIPLTMEQITHLADYIDTYDDLIDVIRRKDGSVRLMLGKKINGHSIIIEAVSKGRESLHPVTAWQIDTDTYNKNYKTRAVGRSSTSHTTQKARQDISRPATAPVDSIIPTLGDGVNSEYVPGGGMGIPMDEGTVSRLTQVAKEMYGADQTQKTAPDAETAIKVGQATILKSPYFGEVPVQGVKKEKSTPYVSDELVGRAQAMIKSAEEESKMGYGAFKNLLTRGYEAIFKSSKHVEVDGLTFQGAPYYVDINNGVPAKVISDVNHSPEKLALLEILPDVVKNGEFVGSTNGKKKVVRYDHFETAVTIHGKPYLALFETEVYPGANNYKTHRLISMELAPQTDGVTGTPPAPSAEAPTPYTKRIPQAADGVNIEYAQPGGEDILTPTAPEMASEERLRQLIQQEAIRRTMLNVDEETEARLTQAAREMYGADQTQKTAPAQGAESTYIDTDPATHTLEQMQKIREYQKATDNVILAFIKKWAGLKDPNYRKKVRIPIAEVTARAVADIKAIVGIDTSGYQHALSGGALEHIARRHGVQGKADHSMADPNDIARMSYVLENYDSVSPVLNPDGTQKMSTEYQNSDNTPAPLVQFSKRIDGTYYVVEAVPDSAARQLRVVSAYLSKDNGSTDQMLNMPHSGPQLTPKAPNGADTSTDPIIPSPGDGVNSEYAPGGGMDILTETALQMSAGSRKPLWQKRNMETIRRVASTFGPVGAQKLQEFYQGSSQALEEYLGGFAVYYHAGLTGQDIMTVQGDHADAINYAQAEAAYLAGRLDAADKQVKFLPEKHSSGTMKATKKPLKEDGVHGRRDQEERGGEIYSESYGDIQEAGEAAGREEGGGVRGEFSVSPGRYRGIDPAFGVKPYRIWAEGHIVEPAHGSVAYAEQEVAIEYGVPSFVVSDEIWEQNRGGMSAPAFAIRGQVYLRKTIPESKRGMVMSHEITHVMKQLGFQPYIDFIKRTPDMLNLSDPAALAMLEQVAKHQKTTFEETDPLRLYDEFNATMYGHIASGKTELFTDGDGMAAFRDFAAYAAELTELHKRFKREARLREGQEKAPELRHETLPEEYGDISQEGPNSGIIEEVNYIIKEDMSRGEEKQESKVDFKRRCDAESYSIYEGSAVTCGYRLIQGESAQANARQIQEELKSLGIAADIIDGGVLWNFDGISSTKDVPEAVTVGSKRIFINNDVALDPRNVAGHEAFHMWRGSAERTAYIEAIENNLLFTSEAFQTYQATIAESYLGGEADLSDPEQVRQLLEEIFAYISGDLHEGGHDAELAPMFRDFDTVKAAWKTLVESQKSAATLSGDEKGALLDYIG